MVGGEAGNVIGKLCAGQATKNGLTNHSVEPLEAHQGEQLVNKEIWKRSLCGHILTQKYENELGKMQFCKTETKLLVARQIIHSKC